MNRILYAIKFQDQNILLNGDINSRSRILYDRSPTGCRRSPRSRPWTGTPIRPW